MCQQLSAGLTVPGPAVCELLIGGGVCQWPIAGAKGKRKSQPANRATFLCSHTCLLGRWGEGLSQGELMLNMHAFLPRMLMITLLSVWVNSSENR